MKSKQVMINGKPATPPAGAIAWKYADPTEKGRWLDDVQEAADVASEDPGLVVWVPGPVLTAWANGGRSAQGMPYIILGPTACESARDARKLLLDACKDAKQGYAEGCLSVEWPEHGIESCYQIFSRHVESGEAVEAVMALADLEAAMASAAPEGEEDETDRIEREYVDRIEKEYVDRIDEDYERAYDAKNEPTDEEGADHE